MNLFPYDPEVNCFVGETLYIKTLNSEFKKLEIKAPHKLLNEENIRLGSPESIYFFNIKDNHGMMRPWSPV
jgi:hypothetical protein